MDSLNTLLNAAEMPQVRKKRYTKQYLQRYLILGEFEMMLWEFLDSSKLSS